MWKVVSPLNIDISKNKRFTLNLNVYRNAHYFTLNKVKHRYKEILLPQLEQLPRFNHITLEYVLYPRTKVLCDVANICCIVDKFFCDALVETKHLEDDNYTVIKDISYKFGARDKVNPRVDIYINEEK